MRANLDLGSIRRLTSTDIDLYRRYDRRSHALRLRNKILVLIPPFLSNLLSPRLTLRGQPAQSTERLPRARWTFLLVLFKTAHQEGCKANGHRVARVVTRAWWRVGHLLRQDSHCRRAVEELSSHKQEVSHRTDRVEICAPIHSVSFCNRFGCHVVGGTCERVFHREAVVSADIFHESKIKDFHQVGDSSPLAKHDVRGFDVSVDHSAFMGLGH